MYLQIFCKRLDFMILPELDAYKHVISKEDRKELGTAIGLFASGVGAVHMFI